MERVAARMKSLGSSAFGIGIALAMLAGCGGSQSPGGATPQTPATAGKVTSDLSWMLPEAKNENLFYVASGYQQVYVFSYPQAKQVGLLAGFRSAVSLCSDENGNVWIVDYSSRRIVEYAHGSTTRRSTLYDPGLTPIGCSVDPTTGDLAVLRYPSSVKVYAPAKEHARTYRADIENPLSCAYDGDGNLFVDGTRGQASHLRFGLGELLKGETKFRRISLDYFKTRIGGGQLQWDGNHVAIAEGYNGLIDRFSIRGGHAVYVDAISLDKMQFISGFWIQGSKIVATEDLGFGYLPIQLYHYPAGGNPFQTVDKIRGLYGQLGFAGVTVSLAPPGSYIRK
jgi:hypothetical protein